MAKLMLIFALCILPAFISVHSIGPPYIVHGRVYCDTCHFGFETTHCTYIHGAKVGIQCKGKDEQLPQDGKYIAQGVTDKTGTYRIIVEDDHKDEVCDAVLISSPMGNCAKRDPGRSRARVVLTNSNGMMSNVRYANNMGFFLNKPLGVCQVLRKQYNLDSADAKNFWRL